jgi:hypothetical protein
MAKKAKKAKKAKAAKKKVNRLKELYAALEEKLKAQLQVSRLAHKNAEAKGNASEEVWIDLLAGHLPHRYQVGKGIVVDSKGAESNYIDIIIYDRQYTPLVFNEDGRMYIPAESVYGIIEAKQGLTREFIIYAGKKAQSVRKLHRTNAPIMQAAGPIPNPRAPSPIVAGIVSYKSSWNPKFGNPLNEALGELTEPQRLDFGMAAEDGYFEVTYDAVGAAAVNTFEPTRALAALIIGILKKLQKVGTVPAIEYSEYMNILDD